MIDIFLDYFFIPLSSLALMIFGLSYILKGWTYRSINVEDRDTTGGNIFFIIVSLILPYLPKHIIKIYYILLGFLIFSLGSCICIFSFEEILHFPKLFIFIIILPLFTWMAYKPAVIMRKPMIPFQEDINEIIVVLREQVWFENLYNNPQYTFLFYKNNTIKIELINYDIEKLKSNMKYQQKIEVRLKDKLYNEFVCTPASERNMDDVTVKTN
ncbi:hypothetical protein [Gottfriedia luciferensis]|uniref:hypothetical protein n=1 Tax=Gottfriedia luciferensis TaxID=178774 RepID=UPI000B448A56|nr:hypothetical protein [Gottfriedia luciferensis]